MKQCLIYNNSLRFFRAVGGILTLAAFLIQNQWLVLAIGLLMVLGVFSTKFNVLYQLHAQVLRKLLKEKAEPIERESGELNFTSGLTGVLLLIGFLLLHFEKFINLAWILVLIMSLLMFLACFAGICVASLMYAFFKKIFKR